MIIKDYNEYIACLIKKTHEALTFEFNIDGVKCYTIFFNDGCIGNRIIKQDSLDSLDEDEYYSRINGYVNKIIKECNFFKTYFTESDFQKAIIDFPRTMFINKLCIYR